MAFQGEHGHGRQVQRNVLQVRARGGVAEMLRGRRGGRQVAVAAKALFVGREYLHVLAGCGGDAHIRLRLKLIEIEGEELLAKAFCHDIDHLEGIIYKQVALRMLDPSEIETDED